MAVLTAVVVATVITAGAAGPAAAGAAAGVIQTAAAGSLATGTAVAGSAGGGAVVGAIAGAAAGGTAGAAGIGTVVGSASAAAVTSSSAGAAGLLGGIASGPVGWLILGAEGVLIPFQQASQQYTLDCWKKVLHDGTSQPSNGKLLKEVVEDQRIKKVTVKQNSSSYPDILLQNIWDEEFRIEYLMLPSNQMAAHAVLLG